MKLLKQNVITKEDADHTVFDRAEAEASLAAAEADRESAGLNLGFTKVAAPISGRISRRNVDPGNLVKADDTLLTTIVALDPVYAYVDVDERTMLRLRRLEADAKVKTNSVSQGTVQIGLADEEGYSLSGTIDFADNRFDANTGTLRIRAVISNPRKFLAPGLFVRLRLPIGNPRPAVLVQEEAIASDQGQKYVYVVDENDEVVYRQVKTGQLEDGFRVIESGLAANERVVIRGLQSIKAGTKVQPSPLEDPASKASTRVADGNKPGADAAPP